MRLITGAIPRNFEISWLVVKFKISSYYWVWLTEFWSGELQFRQ